MRQGVLTGSSRAMQNLPVAVAGKTGTAQFGNQGKTHAWYATYAPYDHPEIAIVVIVEGGGEGNATALPVAHDTLRWYYTVHKNH
jgi:peptidoglycan glycosyltransferase